MRRLIRVLVVTLAIAGLLMPAGVAEAKVKKTTKRRSSRSARKAPQPMTPGPLVIGFTVATPAIALTFDDGAANTAAIVSILRAQDAKGTFFVCGARMGEASEVASAVANGFEIGNHTFDHVSLYGQSYAFDAAQIAATSNAIQAASGVRPAWIRSRSGQIDAIGMQAVRDAGQSYINWDVHSLDTDWSLTSAQIEARVVGSAHPGAVVLMHATRPETLAALPGIVGQLKARGYRLVTVSQLAGMGSPRFSSETKAKAPKKVTSKKKPAKVRRSGGRRRSR